MVRAIDSAESTPFCGFAASRRSCIVLYQSQDILQILQSAAALDRELYVRLDIRVCGFSSAVMSGAVAEMFRIISCLNPGTAEVRANGSPG